MGTLGRVFIYHFRASCSVWLHLFRIGLAGSWKMRNFAPGKTYKTMQTINFDDGEQVKAEVLRLIKEGKRTYSSAGEDKEGEFYEYRWADASMELSVCVRTNTFSLFLDLTFRFPRPMCPMSVNKLITIPVAGELEPNALMLEVLTKSIEAYEPAN